MENYKEKYEQALERCKEEFNFNNLAYSHEEIKQRLERVFPELKKSEDEKIKEEIKVILANTDLSQFALDYTFADMIAWLKSLKERYTWKPSESDILLLERIANGKSNPQDFQASLGGLIGQLKKLRKE